ncbi:DUF4296 domain-containing protein [Winogradskyella immobilis]|uniref:DUF4296 domain-containing protein n=1 Tax=Winogradskyella immobilis TaxID=2816852 RepID=A0ABS8EJA3_9FLAO|nr:DUF4296 domain-containing protein [Winogradskyella immobilis]MCC1483041.1 DUF4296 domain-containing protein [Winogradskyella immobilis]MCG0015136.1 DUF4296 domain-containing protein [Winogradskyella immobilis]
MKYIYGIFLLVFITSCESNIKPKKPENLIPKEDMTNVLFDMFVVNSAKGLNKKLLEVKGVSPEKYILEKYQIDSLQFAQSNNYYAHDIETYKTIIEEVKEKITTQRKVFEEIEKKEKEEANRRRDSIKAAQKKNGRIINEDSIRATLKIKS